VRCDILASSATVGTFPYEKLNNWRKTDLATLSRWPHSSRRFPRPSAKFSNTLAVEMATRAITNASVTHMIPRGDSPAGVWRLHGTLKGKFRSQRVEGAGNWLRSVEGCDLDPPGQPLVDAGCRRRLYLFIGPRRQERPTELI
jgi:hypothetical protein